MGKSMTKHLQAWAIRNPMACVLVGISIIEIGLIVDFLEKRIPNVGLFILAHGFIILGEVIAVTFFLYLFIEERQHEQNTQMLSALGSASKEILQEQSRVTQSEFQTLISEFKEQADIIIDGINESLFEAILKDNYPIKL